MRHCRVATAAALALLAAACGEAPDLALDEPSSSPSPRDHGVAACDDLDPLTDPPEESPVDGPLADDPEVAAAQQRRAELRLDSDADTTRAVLDELEGDDRGGPGHPVLAEEEGEVNPPMEVVEAVAAYQRSEMADSAGGHWIDRDAGGVITVGVTEDAEAHAEAIAELDAVAAHDEHVEVVEVAHSSAELDAAQQRITEVMQADLAQLEGAGAPEPGMVVRSGRAADLNRVTVDMIDDEDGARRDELAEVAGDADLICVNMFEPPAPPEPADGVRPLAKAEGHDADAPLDDTIDFAELAIAHDAEAGAQLWDAAVPDDLPAAEAWTDVGRHGGLDDVDWETEALVLWRSGESGSCPAALVSVDVAADGAVEVATDADSGPSRACTDDYNPYRMILAVDRDRLPGADALPADLDGTAGGEAVAWP